MSNTRIARLADCTEYRQTLAARPPAIVHGTILLLICLMAAAVAWSALVEANLVVVARGRVRPVDTPARIYTPAGAELAGRVVESPFEEGDVVKKGDLLVRLDTEQIDNRIAKLQRMIAASREELSELDRLETVHARQFDSARRKANLELQQAKEQLKLQRERQASEVRRAKAALAVAGDDLQRLKQLRSHQATTERDVVEATAKVEEAREQLVQAQLPIDERSVGVREQALELVARDYEVRQAELAARRVVKQGELASAHKELENLQLQRTHATLQAPTDGVVIKGRIKSGDVLEPGKAVMEIASQGAFQFEAAVSSEDVGHLRRGMPVRIKFDAYDYQRYGVLQGTVTYISPDSRIEEAQGRPVSVAYIVRVALPETSIGRGELRGDVKLGLGGTAEIVTGRKCVLRILFKKVRQTISLG